MNLQFEEGNKKPDERYNWIRPTVKYPLPSFKNCYTVYTNNAKDKVFSLLRTCASTPAKTKAYLQEQAGAVGGKVT